MTISQVPTIMTISQVPTIMTISRVPIIGTCKLSQVGTNSTIYRDYESDLAYPAIFISILDYP